MKNFKETKGITLIALVITIIVLLILAGITIAMIAGQDSAPAKAVEARNANKVGEAKDAAALLVTNYMQQYYNGKYVGNEAAAKNAENVGAYISAKLANPVTKGEHTFQVENGTLTVSDTSNNEIVSGAINPNGTITWTGEATNVGNNSGSTTPITPATPTTPTTPTEQEVQTTGISVETLQGMVGKTVDYLGYSASYNQGWRLFYADNDYAYLITTESIASSTAFGGSSEIPLSNKNFETVMAEDSYGRKWNSLWLSQQEAITSGNRYQKIMYLCDSDNWEEYVAENAPSGTKAYGAATLQLLIASWNLRENSTGDTIIDESGLTEYGYRKPDDLASGISVSTKSPDGTERLYNNGVNYWLASPSQHSFENGSGYYGSIWFSFSSNETIACNLSYVSCDGIRPIVVVPRDKITESSNGTTLEVIMDT